MAKLLVLLLVLPTFLAKRTHVLYDAEESRVLQDLSAEVESNQESQETVQHFNKELEENVEHSNAETEEVSRHDFNAEVKSIQKSEENVQHFDEESQGVLHYSHSAEVESGHKSMSPITVEDLSIRTYQKRGTTGCWFLSVLETLRKKGFVKSWFARGIIKVKQLGVAQSGAPVYGWQTAAGNQGQFEAWSKKRGIWQQVLESILVTGFGKPPEAAQNFQGDIAAAMANTNTRYQDIANLLNLIVPGIMVQQDIFHIIRSKSMSEFQSFLDAHPGADKETMRAGGVTVWTLDKGRTHAIAVTMPPYYDGKWNRYFCSAYNQQTGQLDQYQIGGKSNFQCESTENDGATCDSIFVYDIMGLLG